MNVEWFRFKSIVKVRVADVLGMMNTKDTVERMALKYASRLLMSWSTRPQVR